MSNRLNQERQAKLEPVRIETAIKKLEALGFAVANNGKSITFIHKGRQVTYFPYSGWATGKTIQDGRGLRNLLKQLKGSNNV